MLAKYSDILVIGLQEFAPLSLMTAMLGPGEERVARWDHLISSHLAKIYLEAKYTKFYSHIMMGLCTLLYGRTEIIDSISNIQTAKTKTGFQGVGENKGAVILR